MESGCDSVDGVTDMCTIVSGFDKTRGDLAGVKGGANDISLWASGGYIVWRASDDDSVSRSSNVSINMDSHSKSYEGRLSKGENKIGS